MNSMEKPGETPMHTSSAPINLDTDQRINLLHELRALSSELQENLFITPANSIIELKGIRLKPLVATDPAASMGLRVTSSDHEPFSASISLSSGQREARDQRTYIHRPSFNLWEEWRAGISEPLNLLSTSKFIETLEPQLPTGTIESLMDTPTTGTDVANLLANFLKNRARTHIEYTHYKAHDIQFGPSEHTRDTDFVVETNNRRVTRNLFVAASFDLSDFGHLRKTYRYEAVDTDGYLKSTYGNITVAVGANVPKARLNAFALRDSIRNDPSYGINIGLDDIRHAYISSEEL